MEKNEDIEDIQNQNIKNQEIQDQENAAEPQVEKVEEMREENVTEPQVEKVEEMREENSEKTKNECRQESSSETSEKKNEELKQDDALKELEEKYMRVYADFENTKKRLEREKSHALEYAHEIFSKDLLTVLDALENAKEAAKDNQAILEGIILTKDNLLRILNKHGVNEITSSGEFDPNLHESIMQVADSKAEDGHISKVLQKGYTYKGRTLRPALVAVAKN